MKFVMESAKDDRLSGFEQQSMARLPGAQHGMVEQESRLAVMVGAQACLLDLREVAEVVHCLPITPVPRTQEWYLGLANVRGSLISVTDLSHCCGAASTVPGQHSRLIILPAGLASQCAFLVSGVLGLRYLRDMRLSDAPRASAQWPFGQHYLDRDMVEWTEIRLASIVADTRFLDVGR